jgi:hypothetical protein
VWGPVRTPHERTAAFHFQQTASFLVLTFEKKTSANQGSHETLAISNCLADQWVYRQVDQVGPTDRWHSTRSNLLSFSFSRARSKAEQLNCQPNGSVTGAGPSSYPS